MISNSIDNSNVYTDFQGLDKLKRLARDEPDQALEAVARQFETLFTQTILKGMRSTSLGDGLFDNDQSRLYQDLYDKQISSNLSQRKGVGLADVLIRQLSPKTSQNSEIVHKSKLEKTPSVHNNATITPVPESNEIIFKTPEDYLKTMYPIARDIESTHGIPATVMLAQSALETGWGKHIIKDNVGGNSFNLFGIKADARWQGGIAHATTVEFRGGVAEMSRENFRSYGSFRESMNDYADFLTSSPRYSQVLENVTDPKLFSLALQQAGYATDPEYSNKINRIVSSVDFGSIVEKLKNEESGPLT